MVWSACTVQQAPRPRLIVPQITSSVVARRKEINMGRVRALLMRLWRPRPHLQSLLQMQEVMAMPSPRLIDEVFASFASA